MFAFIIQLCSKLLAPIVNNMLTVYNAGIVLFSGVRADFVTWFKSVKEFIEVQ
mgnify:CR=1 FL=1